MITDEPIYASLATSDLERARSWYADKLGLMPDPTIDGVLVYEDGGSTFTIYESAHAGTARNTVMMRNVPNLRAEVDRLRERGVVFEEYDLGDMGKTVEGVMAGSNGELLAWFKDADGNVIGLSELPDDPMPLPWSPMLPASDLARAKGWYHDKLGLEPAFDSPGAVTYESGTTAFTVYPSSFAGTARNTVAIWRIADVRSEVARLRGRGVVFEDYDLGELGKTVDGVLETDDEVLAWFMDSEGNTLGLAQDNRPPA